ncbi:MAG TPA: hypothetical protein VJG32_05995 [Anaerolineae bacterium]|nr:hypothetical protein [Anaerolineae bacterium]
MRQSTILTYQLEGAIVAYTINALQKGVLIVGPDYRALIRQLQADGAQLIEQGGLTLRLGVALYDRPFLFVPHSIIDEAGGSLAGEAVFDWLRRMAYDMPRSEVFGVNARGKEDQVFAREVDVEVSPIVVGGPETSPVYVACVFGAAQLPPRFAAALKIAKSAEASEVRRIVEAA